MSRTTANILLGILIGGCALIVIDRFRRVVREENAEQIAARIGEHLDKLESRVSSIAPAQAAVRA